MRVMAIDLGDVRTGLAISDLTGMIAGRAWTITGTSLKNVAEQIQVAAEENNVGTLVLGLPKNMNNTLGPKAEKCMRFGQMLEEMTGLKVVMWDERRTTVDAHRILGENGKRAKNRKNTVDAVAATLILEGYLGFAGN